MYCSNRETVSCGYALRRKTSWATMSRPKIPMGRNRGFHLIFISPSRICFPIQSRNKAADPVSNRRIDQGSTAPNASGPNRSKPKVPYSSALPAWSAARRWLGFMLWALMRLNLPEGEELRPLGHEVEIVDPELTTNRTSFRQTPDVEYHEPGILSGGEFAGGGFP